MKVGFVGSSNSEIAHTSITHATYSHSDKRSMQRKYTRSYVLRLPNELLTHIFSFLDANELLELSSVCRRFRKIIKDNTLWKLVLTKDLQDYSLLPRKSLLKESYLLYQRLGYALAYGSYNEGFLSFKEGYNTQSFFSNIPVAVCVKQLVLVRGAFSNLHVPQLSAFDLKSRKLLWQIEAPLGIFYVWKQAIIMVQDASHLGIVSLKDGMLKQKIEFPNSNNTDVSEIGIAHDSQYIYVHTNKDIYALDIQTGLQKGISSLSYKSVNILSMYKSTVYFTTAMNTGGITLHAKDTVDNAQNSRIVKHFQGVSDVYSLYKSAHRALFQRDGIVFSHSKKVTTNMRLHYDSSSDGFYTASCSAGPFQFIAGSDGKIHIIDMLYAYVIRTIKLKEPVYSMQFTKNMLIVSMSNSIKVLDFSSALGRDRSVIFKDSTQDLL